MYLLVDSGSTKADWVLFDHQKADFFATKGINPSTQNAEFIQNQIATLPSEFFKKPKKIFFYGAGSQSKTAKSQLVSIFKTIFPVSKLVIESDLLAAGRALCNGQEAIICILGTGSHSALCDGHQIIHQLPALGYILGDEGSGNHLGKEILRAYYYQNLDTDLKETFELKHPEILTDFIYKLYHSQNPSSMLAKYGQFIIENKKHPNCYHIIMKCLEYFINSKLIIYIQDSALPVHLCGSIAYYLKDEIELCLKKFDFKMGECIQKPIHRLLEYHRGEI